MGLYYTLITCINFNSSLLSQLELFEVFCLSFFLSSIIIIIIFFSVFHFFRFYHCPGNFPQGKLPYIQGLDLGQRQDQGWGWEAIFLWGNCPKTVFFNGGKQGDFLHASKMFGFIHLLYVRSCTFLYILNELNGVSQMKSIHLKPKVLQIW